MVHKSVVTTSMSAVFLSVGAVLVAAVTASSAEAQFNAIAPLPNQPGPNIPGPNIARAPNIPGPNVNVPNVNVPGNVNVPNVNVPNVNVPNVNALSVQRQRAQRQRPQRQRPRRRGHRPRLQRPGRRGHRPELQPPERQRPQHPQRRRRWPRRWWPRSVARAGQLRTGSTRCKHWGSHNGLTARPARRDQPPWLALSMSATDNRHSYSTKEESNHVARCSSRPLRGCRRARYRRGRRCDAFLHGPVSVGRSPSQLHRR